MRRLLILVIAALLGAPAVAAADTITFTGLISADDFVTSAAYTATYTYDPALLTTTYSDMGGVRSQISSGPIDAALSFEGNNFVLPFGSGSFGSLYKGLVYDVPSPLTIFSVGVSSPTASLSNFLSFSDQGLDLNTGRFQTYDADDNVVLNYDLRPTAVSESPEPGMWLLLFSGVALMGAALRRPSYRVTAGAA